MLLSKPFARSAGSTIGGHLHRTAHLDGHSLPSLKRVGASGVPSTGCVREWLPTTWDGQHVLLSWYFVCSADLAVGGHLHLYARLDANSLHRS